MAWQTGAQALEEWREALRTFRPARLPVDPFLERDFVVAMDDVWDRVAPSRRLPSGGLDAARAARRGPKKDDRGGARIPDDGTRRVELGRSPTIRGCR